MLLEVKGKTRWNKETTSPALASNPSLSCCVFAKKAHATYEKDGALTPQPQLKPSSRAASQRGSIATIPSICCGRVR
jgi:hypothetical protein